MLALGFVVDYIDLAADWWEDFVSNFELTEIIVKSARVVSMNKLTKWMTKQVSPGLYVFRYIMGEEEFNQWLEKSIRANPKRVFKWSALMQLK